jgi:TolB-like protein
MTKQQIKRRSNIDMNLNALRLTLRTKPLRRALMICAALGSLSALSACSAAALIGQLPLYEEDSNIVAPSHTAADVVAQQLKKRIHTGQPIIVQDFWNNHNPRHISAFGRVVPEQISTRLIQLGYQIIQPRYAQQTELIGQQNIDPSSSSELFLAGQQQNLGNMKKYMDNPHIILSGSYTKATDQVKIHVRMTDSTSGIFVAAYDYDLPITREVEELMGLKR